MNVFKYDKSVDLSDYYPSVEWDIMSRVAIRRTKNYPSCCPQSDAYIDIMVGKSTLRVKTYLIFL